MRVIEIPENELTEPNAASIASLMISVWPAPGKTKTGLTQRIMAAARKEDDSIESKKLRYVVWNDARVIAHARTFVRRIAFDGQRLDVLALANVCTDPDFRGKGLGKAVVERALTKRVQLGLTVCLFQTGVVPFYEKLGGRQIGNRFVNRFNRDAPLANPWWDDAVMIVPADAEWPEGTIDLGGEGF